MRISLLPLSITCAIALKMESSQTSDRPLGFNNTSIHQKDRGLFGFKNTSIHQQKEWSLGIKNNSVYKLKSKEVESSRVAAVMKFVEEARLVEAFSVGGPGFEDEDDLLTALLLEDDDEEDKLVAENPERAEEKAKAERKFFMHLDSSPNRQFFAKADLANHHAPKAPKKSKAKTGKLSDKDFTDLPNPPKPSEKELKKAADMWNPGGPGAGGAWAMAHNPSDGSKAGVAPNGKPWIFGGDDSNWMYVDQEVRVDMDNGVYRQDLWGPQYDSDSSTGWEIGSFGDSKSTWKWYWSGMDVKEIQQDFVVHSFAYRSTKLRTMCKAIMELVNGACVSQGWQANAAFVKGTYSEGVDGYEVKAGYPHGTNSSAMDKTGQSPQQITKSCNKLAQSMFSVCYKSEGMWLPPDFYAGWEPCSQIFVPLANPYANVATDGQSPIIPNGYMALDEMSNGYDRFLKHRDPIIYWGLQTKTLMGSGSSTNLWAGEYELNPYIPNLIRSPELKNKYYLTMYLADSICWCNGMVNELAKSLYEIKFPASTFTINQAHNGWQDIAPEKGYNPIELATKMSYAACMKKQGFTDEKEPMRDWLEDQIAGADDLFKKCFKPNINSGTEINTVCRLSTENRESIWNQWRLHYDDIDYEGQKWPDDTYIRDHPDSDTFWEEDFTPKSKAFKPGHIVDATPGYGIW